MENLPAQQSNVLIVKGVGESDAGKKNTNKNEDTIQNSDSSEIVCYYYKEPDHMKRNCKKLQNKNHKTTTVSAASSSSENIVSISIEEYAQYQDLLKGSTPVTASFEISKTYLISSSHK